MRVVFIGDCLVDEYYTLVDNFPSVGGKCEIAFNRKQPGGMVANAACVYAQYGNDVYLITTLAKQDPYTKDMLNNLLFYGVKTDYIQQRKSDKNDTAIIISGEKERSIFVVNTNYKKNSKSYLNLNFTKKNAQLVQSAGFVYLTNDALKGLSDKTLFWNVVQKNNTRIFLDLDNSAQVDEKIIKRVSIVSINEHGAKKIFGTQNVEKKIAHYFSANSTLEMFIVTKSASGACVYTKQKMYRSKKGYKPIVKDTTGAGDCFNATFLFCILNAYSIQDALNLANKAGGYATTFYGGRFKINLKKLKTL